MVEQQDSTGPAQALNNTEIHACMDVLPPLALQSEARRLAIEENPKNGSELEDPQTGRRAFILNGKVWSPGRTLRVRFLGGTEDVQKKVIQYARKWGECTSLKFDFGNHPNAEIRISFVTDGSWSYIGTDCLAIPAKILVLLPGWNRSDW